MHYYQHNIKTFNSATRYLTRVERALYRDLIELYYDSEQPLTTDEKRLHRLIIVTDEAEKEAMKFVLNEFFELKDDAYHHEYCKKEIEKYQKQIVNKSLAGKASAAKRKQNVNKNSTGVQQDSTGVQQMLNKCATNHKPITNNNIRKNIKKRMMDYPTDFTIGAKSKEFAASHGIDANYELEQFKNHALANGKQFVNWQAGFRTWLGNAVKFAGKKNNVVSLQTQTESFYEYL